MTPTPTDPAAQLAGRRLLIVGAGSNIARALAVTAAGAGADVVLAGPHADRLEATAAAVGGPAETVVADIGDEDSLAALAERVGELDYLVSTAAMPANGPVRELALADVERAFRAKVAGPLMLMKHLDGQFREGGAVVLFSGVAAWRPMAERSVMVATNAAVAALAQALALELAPLRVNAVSPGIIDSGAWDRMGEAKAGFLAKIAAANPARRVGASQDVVQAVLFGLTNPFVTGTVLHVDGGHRLA